MWYSSQYIKINGFDADAQAFFDATGITDDTQKNAVNQLVLDLKSYGIWSKMYAIYPMVGGTAGAHKYNLKDPRDLDAAFRLTFAGGWTHSSNGAESNGTNGYAETYIKQNTAAQNSVSFGVYAVNNFSSNSGQKLWFGSYGTGNQYTQLGIFNTTTSVAYANSGSNANYSPMWYTGLMSLSRTASNLITTYKNGTAGATSTAASVAPSSTVTHWIGAQNYASDRSWINDVFRFVYYASGLNSTEMGNLYTAVQAYQTSLSRNV